MAKTDWAAWKAAVVAAGIERPTPTTTRAFLHATHSMNGQEMRDRAAAKADAIALLTMLQDTTQSRSVAERCAKAKAVLS